MHLVRQQLISSRMYIQRAHVCKSTYAGGTDGGKRACTRLPNLPRSWQLPRRSRPARLPQSVPLPPLLPLPTIPRFSDTIHYQRFDKYPVVKDKIPSKTNAQFKIVRMIEQMAAAVPARHDRCTSSSFMATSPEKPSCTVAAIRSTGPYTSHPPACPRNPH